MQVEIAELKPGTPPPPRAWDLVTAPASGWTPGAPSAIAFKESRSNRKLLPPADRSWARERAGCLLNSLMALCHGIHKQVGKASERNLDAQMEQSVFWNYCLKLFMSIAAFLFCASGTCLWWGGGEYSLPLSRDPWGTTLGTVWGAVHLSSWHRWALGRLHVPPGLPGAHWVLDAPLGMEHMLIFILATTSWEVSPLPTSKLTHEEMQASWRKFKFPFHKFPFLKFPGPNRPGGTWTLAPQASEPMCSLLPCSASHPHSTGQDWLQPPDFSPILPETAQTVILPLSDMVKTQGIRSRVQSLWCLELL